MKGESEVAAASAAAGITQKYAIFPGKPSRGCRRNPWGDPPHEFVGNRPHWSGISFINGFTSHSRDLRALPITERAPREDVFMEDSGAEYFRTTPHRRGLSGLLVKNTYMSIRECHVAVLKVPCAHRDRPRARELCTFESSAPFSA